MKKLRKYVAAVLAAASILMLSACGSSFEYDKGAVVKSAQELIAAANAKDYQAVIDMLHENVRSQLSADKLKDAWDPPLSSAGAFVEYENATTTGVTQNGDNFIIAIIPCKYEYDTLIFTITYTADLKIAALEMS